MGNLAPPTAVIVQNTEEGEKGQEVKFAFQLPVTPPKSPWWETFFLYKFHLCITVWWETSLYYASLILLSLTFSILFQYTNDMWFNVHVLSIFVNFWIKKRFPYDEKHLVQVLYLCGFTLTILFQYTVNVLLDAPALINAPFFFQLPQHLSHSESLNTMSS